LSVELIFKTLIHAKFIRGRHDNSVEKRGSTSSQVSSCLRSYDANIKLIVINHAEAMGNNEAGMKFGITESNVCR
jgi:hypothetical protein